VVEMFDYELGIAKHFVRIIPKIENKILIPTQNQRQFVLIPFSIIEI
jgi:hypothetical protein